MKKAFIVLFLLAIVIVAGVAVTANVFWGRINEPFKGYASAEQFVEIPPGAGAAQIRRRLIDAKVVRDELTFRTALRWTGLGQSLKAGEYRFDQAMSATEVIE